MITICHCSGGPLLDIIDNGISGFLAKNEQEFVELLLFILKNHKELEFIRKNAIQKAKTFDNSTFVSRINQLIDKQL